MSAVAVNPVEAMFDAANGEVAHPGLSLHMTLQHGADTAAQADAEYRGWLDWKRITDAIQSTYNTLNHLMRRGLVRTGDYASALYARRAPKRPDLGPHFGHGAEKRPEAKL